MKKNMLLVPVIAALFTFVMVSVAAGELAKTNSIVTEFNDVELDSSITMAGSVGEVVPVRVTFDADKNESDVRVRVRMEGHRDEISDETKRFDIIEDSTYTKLLKLELPSDEDDRSREYTLYVQIVSSGDRSEEEYTIRMQRESHTLEILSVDYPTQVEAGSSVPVSVVAKNTGFNREDDNYLVASISALGISARTYIGDLIAVEDKDLDHEEDSAFNKVYLKIPSNVQPGVYDMEVMVFNDDSKVMVKKKINIAGSASATILAASKSKDLNAGETVSYELIVVNSGSSVKIFSLDTVSGDALSVSAPSVFTVGPDASETVTITVRASEDAAVGSYSFSANVNGKAHVFTANVIGGSSTTSSTSVVALTVVLVIIFVVLLAVLVVLLTRKEKPIEDIETSYY